MLKLPHVYKLPGVFLVVGILILASLLWFTPTLARDYAQETEQYCLSCHSNPDLEMTLPSGETLSLYVSQDQIKDLSIVLTALNVKPVIPISLPTPIHRLNTRAFVSYPARIMQLARSVTPIITRKRRIACMPRWLKLGIWMLPSAQIAMVPTMFNLQTSHAR